MLASHYVMEEILEKWDNLEEVKEKFEKLSQRYPKDREFQEIYQDFQEETEKKSKNLDKIKQKLESLKNTRKTDSSGGARDLPYSDRRHLSEEYGRA